MSILIYGVLPISDGFRDELSYSRPAMTQPDFMVHCSVDSSSDRNIRYLLFNCKSKDSENIALGVCSWLSFRSSPRVFKFRIQCCDPTEVTKNAAASFVQGLTGRISPQSTVVFEQKEHHSSYHMPAHTLLMQLPSELRAIGDTYVNTDPTKALGYYDSASSVMIHWTQHRNKKATVDWMSLMFDLVSSRLDIYIRQDRMMEIKETLGDAYKRSLNLARDWCSSDLLAKEKRVIFLSRYATAQEIWGSPEISCISISVALKLDPENKELRQRLHQLRRSLSTEVHSFLREFGDIFADPTPSFGAVHEEDLSLLTKRSCSICLDRISVHRSKAVEISCCKHMFYEDCIFNWLKKSSGTCPICRKDL